ncbi:MAG: peptidoglycan editing factor PgeF [Candidatus Gottesmanbacteria bacterium]
MIQKTHNGLYESTFFSVKTGVVHGFTSKKHTSMQEASNREAALTAAGFNPKGVVCANQSHGNSIRVVTHEDCGKTFDDVDGFIYRKDVSTSQQPILTVHVGDCVPLLFVDPHTDIIGAVHAGWKGTKEHVSKEMIRMFMRCGSKPKNILVAIGPYIHACCYDVDEERAMLFEREFPGGRGIVNKAGDHWYIDIGKANIHDLKQSGVLEGHIDWNEQLCTYCNADEFYSFRRKTERFGEIMGYIGYHEL